MCLAVCVVFILQLIKFNKVNTCQPDFPFSECQHYFSSLFCFLRMQCFLSRLSPGTDFCLYISFLLQYHFLFFPVHFSSLFIPEVGSPVWLFSCTITVFLYLIYLYFCLNLFPFLLSQHYSLSLCPLYIYGHSSSPCILFLDYIHCDAPPVRAAMSDFCMPSVAPFFKPMRADQLLRK